VNLLQKAHSLTVRAAGGMAKLHLRMLGVKHGDGLVLFGRPIVSLVPGAKISIGRKVVLCSWSHFTALGVNHPVVLRAMAPGARIEIGDHVGISGGSICAAQSVTIGACTMFGANVTVADTDFHPLTAENRRYSNDGVKSAPVVVGQNVFVGTGAMILKGVHIGDNSIIGAGSVVTRDIPANTIAAGNPCVVLRHLESVTHTMAARS
jgi:acetyltransferase-like isoleucine patch superfamily enzyme